MERPYRALIRFFEGALTITMAGAVIVLVLQVFFRNVIFQSLSWSDELARYLLVWTTYVGAVVALERSRHIAFEGLVDVLPPVLRRVAVWFSDLIQVLFFALLTYLGVRWLLVTKNWSITLPLPMALVYSIIPISAAAMLIIKLIQLIGENWGAQVDKGGRRA